MARFNLKKPRTREFELRKDATVQVPVAVLGAKAEAPGKEIPWEDLYKDAMRQVDELQRAKSELIDFGSSASSMCLALAKMLHDLGGPHVHEDKVVVPKWLHEQMIGASITIGSVAQTGDLFVQIRERGSARVSPAE